MCPPRDADVVMAQSPSLGREERAHRRPSHRVQRYGKIHIKHAFLFKELVTSQELEPFYSVRWKGLKKKKKKKLCLHLENSEQVPSTLRAAAMRAEQPGPGR